MLRYETFQLANKCLSDLREQSLRDWVLVIENDCQIVGGDIDKIIDFAGDDFDVIQAQILESDGSIHYDPVQSYVVEIEDRLVHQVVRNPRPGYPGLTNPRRIFHIEKHAFFIRSSTLKELGELEPFLFSRSHWDLSFRLFKANSRILMHPDFKVKFSDYKGLDVDRDFFEWRWTRSKVKESNEYVRDKWRLANYKSSLEWFDEMVSKAQRQSNSIDTNIEETNE